MELYDAEEAMGIRKILAHEIRVKKNPQTKEDTFWIFKDFHGVMLFQGLIWTLAQTFFQWHLKLRTHLYAATFLNNLYWLIFFKKTLTLTENLLNYLHGSEATIWKFFEKWMLRVVSFLGDDAFLPI